jgi:hypothetical protein
VASMNRGSTRRGVLDVLKASGVTFATVLFLPGVLVRVASQLLVAAVTGGRIAHRQLLIELGGEVEYTSGTPRWSGLLLGTVAGPVLIGSILLFPTVVRSTLLDVRPFASISADPATVVSHGTPLTPFIEALQRFGFVGFLRLWFGVSCFYCSVPSAAIVSGADAENRSRPRWSPTRLAVAPLLLLFRLLRAVDALLMFGFAGAYLASGLLVLLIGWRLLTLLAQTTVGV